MVTQRRRRLPAEERRRQLVEVGTRVFAIHGFSRAGTADIARACGIAEPTIYRHFTSKEEYFLAVAREAVGRLCERLKAAAPRDVEALQAFLREEAAQGPELAILGRLLHEGREQPFREAAEEAVKAIGDALASLRKLAPLGETVVLAAALRAAAGMLGSEERWAA